MRSHRSIFVFLVSACLLVACGGGGGGEPPPGATAQIVVGRDDLLDLVETLVMVQSTDGGLLDTRVPDASSTATITPAPDGMYTSWVRDDASGRVELLTVVGIEPGERIVEHEPRTVAFNRYRIAVSGNPPRAWDSIDYSTALSMGTRSTLEPGFETSLPSEFLEPDGGLAVLLRSDIGGVYDAFAYALLDAPTPDVTIPVDLTGTWRTDWQEVRLDLPDITLAHIENELEVFAMRGGHTYGWVREPGSVAGQDSDLFRLPRGFAEMLQIEQFVDFDEASHCTLVARVAVDAVTDRIEAPPTPRPVVPDPLDVADPTRMGFAWTWTPPGGAGLYQRLSLLWEDGDTRYVWRILLPPTVRSFRLPELPAALADARPPRPTIENRFEAYVSCVDDGGDGSGYAAQRLTPSDDREGIAARRLPGYRLQSGSAFDTPFGLR